MATVLIETIELEGPAGRIKVNKSDEQIYAQKGYKRIEEASDNASDSEKPLGDMKVPELREYAENNNIDLTGLTRKEDIIAAIEQANSEASEENEDNETEETEETEE